MKTRYAQIVLLLCCCVLAFFSLPLQADNLADIICYCEMGTNPAGSPLAGWRNPANVLTQDDEYPGISLGNWNDGTTNYSTSITGGYNLNQGNPPGLVVGFSTAVNNGVGNDLLIMGNAFLQEGSDYYWSEPGYIEVAMETTIPGQTGATVNGWMDETFYLIKPGNYDIVGDPRLGALSGVYNYTTDSEGIQTGTYPGSWGEDLINAGGSQLDLYGYADWNPSGDCVDISDAIDTDGNYVTLSNIAYVRIRTVTNDIAGIFGSISTEVCYVENISVVPEPTSIVLLSLAAVGVLRTRKGYPKQI